MRFLSIARRSEAGTCIDRNSDQSLANHVLQYRDRLWQLKARHGTIVVLPERFINELCYLSEEFVSLEAINTDVRTKHIICGTKIGLPWDCRVELTHPLAILYTIHAIDTNIYWT